MARDREVSARETRQNPRLLSACAGQLHGDVRRGADDPGASIGVGRAALGHASEGFQQQDVLFGEHGVFHFFDGATANLAKLDGFSNPE
jgi:hypothetical protein